MDRGAQQRLRLSLSKAQVRKGSSTGLSELDGGWKLLEELVLQASSSTLVEPHVRTAGPPLKPKLSHLKSWQWDPQTGT